MRPTYLEHGAVLFHLYSARIDKRLVVRARIAEAAVARMGDKAPSHIRVELNGNGASGHGLAQAVARGVAARTKGAL